MRKRMTGGGGGGIELYRDGVGNLNLTPFFLSGGIHMVSDPWTSSRGKMSLL